MRSCTSGRVCASVARGGEVRSSPVPGSAVAETASNQDVLAGKTSSGTGFPS